MKLRECNDLYMSSQIRPGIVRSMSLSDELDSATIILSNTDRINIEPNDLVELTNEYNKLEYWLVANYTREVFSVAPLKYNYTIDLMSPTRVLETIILPNLTITNIGQNRSILFYIQEAIRIYANNSNENLFAEYGNCTLSAELVSLCQSTVCPECVFEEPTLREYLDYLLGFKNCLAKLIYESGHFVLTYLDLNPSGSSIEKIGFVDLQQSQTAEQYVTQLEHTFSNVVSQNPITEYHRLKSDSFLFDSESAKLVLNRKPYDINKLIVKNASFQIYAYMKYSNNDNIIDHATIYVNSDHEEGNASGGLYRYINNYEIDITDYLVIDSIFQTLETLPQGSFSILNDDLANNNYVNNSLRWSRGNNIIDNFHYYQTKTIIWTSSDEPAIIYAIRSAILKKLDSILASISYTMSDGVRVTYSRYDSHATKGIFFDYSWKDNFENVIFEVNYIPYVNAKLKIPQDAKYRHLVSTPDNSTNITTDISSFIRGSFEKNRQLGNDSLMFNARTVLFDKPYYKLGQTYKDEDGNTYLLSYLEYESKNNYVLYKGILTKNYSNRNIHTVINREKRYYSLADSSESVVRHEISVQKYNVVLENYQSENTERTIMLVKPFNILKFTATANDNDNKVSGYISADTIAEENMVSHSALFYDNAVYATRVGEKKNGGYEMQCLKYVDSYGEVKSFDAEFKYATGNNLDVILNCEAQYKEDNAFLGSNKVSFDFLKDSREQICLTTESIIVNKPNDSNITINESKIASLLNSKFITFSTKSAGYLMRGDNLSKFGQPLQYIFGYALANSYPTSLEIRNDKGEVCISIKNYNGEFIGLKKVN